MPPDQSVSACQIPDWLIASWGWVVVVGSGLAVAGKWFVSETSDGGGATALGLIFALNAGFASIDSFTRGFLSSLRRDFCRRTAKYRDPKWLETIPPNKNSESSNLNAREQLTDLAKAVLDMESDMTKSVRKTAGNWKAGMGICAAATMVCLFIPYYGRILIFLALPVPLFAWRCHVLRGIFRKKAETACSNLESSYNKIMAGLATPRPGEKDLVQQITEIIDDKLKMLNTESSGKKQRAKRKK